MEESEVRANEVIQAYDAQGWHRTGTEVDLASAAWLAESARAGGADPVLERFAFQRLVPGDAFVESDGKRVDGLPLFDALPLAGQAIEATLAPLEAGSAIGLAILDTPDAEQRYEAARHAASHQALITVSAGARRPGQAAGAGPRPGLVAHNATNFAAPFGPPVLQVGSEAREWLEGEANRSATVRLVIQTERAPAESANVVARVPGTKSGLAPVVVSTPRTGWWHCASERGGGIACWLEVLRAVVAAPLEREVVFAAFAGHELNHLGLDEFLKVHGELAAGCHRWIHFGANVGAAAGAAVRVSASQAVDIERAKAALGRHGVGDVGSPPAGTVGGLESQAVHELGGRAIALLGGNDFFHLVTDRWPEAVDIAQVARQARAFVELVREMGAEAD